MEYALLDWDNTVRNGYTLFSLIDYLVETRFIDESVRKKIDTYKEDYSNGLMSHDQLAILACDYYSASLKGKSVEQYDLLLKGFHSTTDIFCIYGFARRIFAFFKENSIIPIVVSGAPTDVVKMYQDEFSIKEIYAYDYGRLNEIFTGETICNHGYNKKEIVNQIISNHGCEPVFAFGDSSSDYEMMSMSRNSVLVSHGNNETEFVADIVISSQISEREIINELRRHLSKQ